MKICICDDEKEYVEDSERHIKQYFSEHGLSCELFKFSNGKDLLESEHTFDIAFLDIELEDINGLEVGRRLQERNSEIVLIYVTAYNHYLDNALDLGITRFFDKPINSQRFYEGLKKAVSRVDNAQTGFYLKNSKNQFTAVKCKDIVFVEIYNRKTRVVTKNKEYFSNENIKFWKQQLKNSYFEIPHNSYVVNTNYITYFCNEYITLDDKYNIPIAYSKRVEFKRKFMRLLEG